MKRLAANFAILTAFLAANIAQAHMDNGVTLAPPVQKKIIMFGWNTPARLDHFNRDLKDLTENAPFDGVAVRPYINITRDGKTYNYWTARPATGPARIYREDFKDIIPAMKRLQNTSLKHNFFLISSTWFNNNWFDDADWNRILENVKVLSWAAKEAGFDGICVDLEPYDFSGCPLAFHPEHGHTREQTAVQVRKRAAQWIQALAETFPELVYYSIFWSSLCKNEQACRYPRASVGPGYEFVVPFINGVYDGAPDTIKILDGAEEQSYAAGSKSEIANVLADYHLFAHGWIDAQNMDKYRKITQLSIGLYLDSYIPRPNPRNYRLFERSDNPARLLHENIRHAFDYSDEYVWIWSESGTFWPKINASKNAPFWNDRLPYVTDAIAAARNLREAAQRHAGPIISRNASFETGAPTKPIVDDAVESPFPQWDAWQTPNAPTGEITACNGAVQFKRVSSAAIAQVHTDFKPGDSFLLTARGKLESQTMTPNINVYFRDSRGEGLWNLRKTAAFEQDDADGWKRATLVFQVPVGIDISNMTICISIDGLGKNTPEGDKGCTFDDFELRKVTFPWDAPKTP